MQSDLNSIQGNLEDFAALVIGDPCRYSEFNLSCLPEDERNQTVIGVKHLVNGKRGSIELIDGAHRAISMVANGVATASAYLALVK